MMETEIIPTSTTFGIQKNEIATYNEQGEIISPSTTTTVSIPPLVNEQVNPTQQIEEEIITLGDTLLAPPEWAECFYPATDDTGLVHEIISFGHVLKSTHDLARWCEKLGSQRVNTAECVDLFDKLILDVPRNPSQRNNNNNTNNRAKVLPRAKSWQLTKTENNNNQQQQMQRSSSINNKIFAWLGTENVELAGTLFVPPVELQESTGNSFLGESKIITSWPVLKSTHDFARWSEKQGTQRVNGCDSAMCIDEVANNEGGEQAFLNRGGNANLNWRGNENIELGDTPLSQPNEQLLPSSNIEGELHQVISVGPVLKSTHDFARRSEKQGPNRVNKADTSMAIDEIVQNFGQSNLLGGPENLNLGDTPLCQPNEPLLPATEQAGPSEIISSWPVLKSTHDMAQWSEKQGKKHVNEAESTMAIDELASNQVQNIGSSDPVVRTTLVWCGTENIDIADTPLSCPNEELMPPSTIKLESKIIASWPVLKSTHDAALLEEKRVVNSFPNELSEPIVPIEQGFENIQLSNTPLSQPNEQLLPPSNEPVLHEIIYSGPVLKSTHDMATWSEKQGQHGVNSSDSSFALDEVVQAQGQIPSRQAARYSRGGFKRNFNRSWRSARRWQGTENVDVSETPLSQPNEQLLPASCEQQHDSKVLNTWPVLKSTHDQATWSEKQGTCPVNEPESTMVMDEVVNNEDPEQMNQTQIPIVCNSPPVAQENLVQEGDRILEVYTERNENSWESSEGTCFEDEEILGENINNDNINNSQKSCIIL